LMKNFSDDRMIGMPGAFGQVYEGKLKEKKYPDCPEKVAVRSPNSKMSTALKCVRPVYLSFLATSQCEKSKAQRNSELLELLTTSNKVELDALLIGAARALRAVHLAEFIHWDIQSRNLILMWVVADFGLTSKRDQKMVYFEDRRVSIFSVNDTVEAKEKYDVLCFGNVMEN
uniref:Protein kinase domain-containing protein n=1 Tax=Setaria italica TaxID=4555 RepID=K3YLG5_SETIT